MKKSALSILVVTLFLAGAIIVPYQALCGTSQSGRSLSYVPGEILVKYNPHVAASHIRESQSRLRVRTVKKFKYIDVRHIRLPQSMTVETALEIYRNDPDVEYAEPNYYRYAKNTPDDTNYDKLWGLNNTGQNVNNTSGTADADIDAPEAWDTTTGSNDIIIAVIDTGVAYDHEDLSDNIWSNTGEIADNDVDDDGNGYVDDIRGWDFVDDDNDPMDSNEHGTHVAGTIAAVGNNATGITGVCWTAKIMPLRIMNGFGTVSAVILAIDYARGNGAKIINASFGSDTYSKAERNAIANAQSAGILFVAAAGNDGLDNDSGGDYPSTYDLDNIISVAATGQSDQLSSFSNYGATSVDVAAPGENIYSAQPARQTVWSDDFEDDDISDWQTGGDKNTWGTTDSQSCSETYSLTDSPDVEYQSDTNSWARIPVLDLSSHRGTKLDFYLWGSSQENHDFLYVEVSTNGSDWTNEVITIDDEDYFDSGISGNYSGLCHSASVDLGPYDGENTVFIRFRFNSDGSITGEGWFIDEVVITAADSTYDGSEYQFLEGTSMSTPHVAGLAGLVWSVNSGLTYTEVKDRILLSTDTKAVLIGKTATGGRINAFNALHYESVQEPGDLSAVAASSSLINLSWTDNSSNESGFKIERKTGSGGAYSQIATVSANNTSYSNAALSAATNYCYRVRAYSDNANSPYSNEASVSTHAASGSDSGGGCFIATAAYGSYMNPHVHLLRQFRDRFLNTNPAGKIFIRLYYACSPPIAEFIAKHKIMRIAVRLSLLPLVGLSWLFLNCSPIWNLMLLILITVTMITVRKKWA